MIPADKCPEWADRHCWDEDGCGEFYGAKANGSTWMSVYEYSDIPLPTGHDWRVPVMRPTVKESLTVDLGHLRDTLERAANVLRYAAHPQRSPHADELANLLALIDGQDKP